MRVVVLSPHRDDAAFSCGLVLRSLLVSGATLSIVNVCTVSSYAPYLPQDHAQHDEESRGAEEQGQVNLVTNIRRREDETFAGRLLEGSSTPRSALNSIDLVWKDVPLRWEMGDELVVAPHSLPAEEIALLSGQFQALPPADLILAPLSLGGHVDHRLVHQAALRAFSAAKLIFYEDLPYAARLSEEQRTVATEEAMKFGRSCLLPNEFTPGWKRELALCYPTQIAPEVADEIEAYSVALGGRERIYAAPEPLLQLQNQLKNTAAAQH